MKTHAIDVDATLENITEALADNAEPQIRGAPTQYGIDQPPREIDPEAQMQHILHCARLPGVDVMSGIDLMHHFVEPSARHCFQIRCMQCSFRFQDRSKVYDLDQLGELHANRNNHDVLLSLRYGGFEAGLIILPVKRSWWSRYKGFCKWVFESKWWAVVCLCVIAWEIFSASTQTGFGRWFSVVLVGVWCYNLWLWGKHKWGNRNDRDTAMGG